MATVTTSEHKTTSAIDELHKSFFSNCKLLLRNGHGLTTCLWYYFIWIYVSDKKITNVFYDKLVAIPLHDWIK